MWMVTFFYKLAFYLKKIHVWFLNDLISFLDFLLGAIDHGVKVTPLDAIVYAAEVHSA